MKAAIVQEIGKAPVYGDFMEPTAGEGEAAIAVTAAALSHLTQSRASGTHYSTSGKVPFVPGVDGVGKLENGKRVYFVLPKAPFGSMAERTVVRTEQCIPLPDDLDDVTAAAIANPGMSFWAALKERAMFKPGENVLVNGATGVSGCLAVQACKYLGAKRVIGTGRNAGVLKQLQGLGADAVIQLSDDSAANEDAFKKEFSAGIDIVLDYLWGPSAQQLLVAAAKSGRDAVPIRFVQIGSMSGSDITLPSAVLRSIAIQLMGSGIGSVPYERLLNAIAEVFAATIPGGFEIDTQVIPLSDVERAWSAESGKARVVFKI